MKKLKIAMVCFLICLSSLLLFACGKTVPVESITLNRSSFEIFIGNETYIELKDYYPENSSTFEIVWTSSNNNVAEVNYRGKVYAKGYGQAVITATVKNTDIKAHCTVVVNDGYVYKLEVNHLNVKKFYNAGEKFDPSGLVVTAFYESGVEKTLNNTEYTIIAPEILTENTTITIQFEKQSYSFPITVTEEKPSKIKAELTSTKTFNIGDNITKEYFNVFLIYTNGKTEKITDFTINQTTLTYGKNTIEISYTEPASQQTFTTSYEIEAKANHIISDITKLQQTINDANEGDSIMIKEGKYNITSSIEIPSSKKIIIFGETQNTIINSYNCPVFTITGDSTEKNITIANLTLSLAQGENIDLISIPDGVKINIKDILFPQK